MAIVVALALLALPFGWGLGVTASYLIAGKELGQLPIMTVPLGLLAAEIFALVPSMKAGKRLMILIIGDVVFIAGAWLLL